MVILNAFLYTILIVLALLGTYFIYLVSKSVYILSKIYKIWEINKDNDITKEVKKYVVKRNDKS